MSSTRGLVADVVASSCVDGPGNRYVVFLQGCNFNCLACHNPHTIPTRGSTGAREKDADELVTDIARAAPFLSGVTVSGGEATLQWPFVDELFRRLAARPDTAGLTRLIDSNGDADLAVWDALADSMHGAMIDLKALDPDVHEYLTGRGNDRVLRSIGHLAALDRLTEVRLLLVPGVNDTPDQLAATAAFLHETAGEAPVALLGFRHHGTRPVARRFHDATDGDLDTAAAVLTANGIDPNRIRGGRSERYRS
ncbi:MAG: radical SAM protein [Ilumatobacteraceae bacterium]